MPFNPALNTDSLPNSGAHSVPLSINSIYLRDGKYDAMGRTNVADSFQAFRNQTLTNRLALFFHGGLVDKVSGRKGAAAEYDAYSDVVFPLFFIWESGFQEVLSHHLPLIFAETIFDRVVSHATDLITRKLPFPADSANLVAAGDQDLSAVSVSSEDIDEFMIAILTCPHFPHGDLTT